MFSLRPRKKHFFRFQEIAIIQDPRNNDFGSIVLWTKGAADVTVFKNMGTGTAIVDFFKGPSSNKHAFLNIFRH